MSRAAARILLALPWLVATAAAQGPSEVRVLGDVELTPVAAIRAGEDRAIDTLWERFGPRWSREKGLLVPAERVEQRLRSFLRDSMGRLAAVRPEPMEVRDTTAGAAYRQGYRIDVAGQGARALHQSGMAVVDGLNRTFRQRYFALAGLWLVLLWASLRLDRATRGYLTGRIRLGILAIGILGTFLIYPS